MIATANLGSEHDLALKDALLQTLREMGADEISTDWGVSGSQEVNTLRCTLNGHPLTVEAETYVGLSITNESRTVEAVAARVNMVCALHPSPDQKTPTEACVRQ